MNADESGRQIGRQRKASVEAAYRAMSGYGVGIGRQFALVALVPWLCAAGAGLLVPLLAICRERLRRGAQRLD
jgi:hypothetical protein